MLSAAKLPHTEREALLDHALATARMGLWTWELGTGSVTCSTACLDLFGHAAEGGSLASDAFFAPVHPDDRPAFHARLQRDMHQHDPVAAEFRVLRPDGRQRWLAHHGQVVAGATGQPVRLLGCVRDITEERAARDSLDAHGERLQALRAAEERQRLSADTSEQRLQVALEASGTGTFRWDIRTDELWWDTALDKLFGLRPGQAVHSLEQFVALVHPDDRSGVIERCLRCKEEGADFEMEFRVVHGDGSVHWLYDRGRTFVDGAGRPSYMTGACVDTTERRRVEQALRDSEAFYRRTLESVPGMTFSTTEDGDCDYLSEQWVAYTGVRADAHFGHAWLQALHPDDRDRAGAVWGRAVRTKAPYVVEYRMRRHDGAYHWFKAQGCLIPGTGGVPGRWIGTIVDVNDLKEAEAALRARERELRTLADNSPDVIARFDRSLRHIFVNAAIERVTGRSVADYLGRTNREVGLPASLCEQCDAAIGRVFRERSPVTMQFDFEHGGALRHFAARLVPECDERGEVDHVLSVTRDITDAWQAQEALRRADRQKDDFLATLAHELRNPLAPLRTGLGVLQRGSSAGEEQRVRDIMQRQLDHMVRLVDELLDIARISQGKVVLRREVLPLQAVLDHAVDGSRPLIEAQGHVLAWDGVDPDWHVHGDVTRLAQVVGNLLNNAAKYTPPGGRIALRATSEGGEICIAVEDTGMGIPRELLGRVFERFVQADQHLERAQGGLGIGLSIVRSLVEMHGGRVVAESAGAGLGSRFLVWLPRAQEPVHAAPPQAAADTPQVPSRKVLIVDDNSDAAETLAMVVRLQGHDADVVGDGASALRAASTQMPDIVFLDIGMPGMNGYEAATRLRAMTGPRRPVLVALTGWGAADDRARSQAAGFDMHLTKPVDLQAVEQVLAGAACTA